MSVQRLAEAPREAPVNLEWKRLAHRLSPNCRAVLDALREAAQPVKAYDLLERLRGSGIQAPMSIYRALDTLIDKGYVRKVQSLNAFVAVPTISKHPVAFVICSTCGKFTMERLSDTGKAWLLESGLDEGATYIESYRPCVGC